MIKPPIPKNEKERIQQLLSYEILDSVAENEYDEITELASSITNAPIALVSLIDVNRQWFKSCYGLTGVTQTDRDLSFCAHALNSPEMLIVDDPLSDERFKDNPLVTGELHIRFYAGVPLIDSEGFALGTLCVVDSKENSLSEIQKKQLKTLAKQVVNLMELRKTAFKVKENYTELSNLIKTNMEQKEQLEQALDNAAKLSVIGELAASIAHEIKNPLFIIGSTCEILGEACEGDDSPLAKETQAAVSAVDYALARIDKIIKGLSNNARTVKDEFKPVLVNEVIEECLAMVSGKIKKQNIDIQVSCSENIRVLGRHSDLGQVVVNLISNALDATAEIMDRKKWIKISTTEDDQFIKISVTDCGDGINSEVSESIFNSFFTTKEVGKGTGLGLSISKKVIEEHHGQIYYDKSNPNTSFVISLPKI